MNFLSDFLKQLAQRIEQAGKQEQATQRVLQGLCVECGEKLPKEYKDAICLACKPKKTLLTNYEE